MNPISFHRHQTESATVTRSDEWLYRCCMTDRVLLPDETLANVHIWGYRRRRRRKRRTAMTMISIYPFLRSVSHSIESSVGRYLPVSIAATSTTMRTCDDVATIVWRRTNERLTRLTLHDDGCCWQTDCCYCYCSFCFPVDRRLLVYVEKEEEEAPPTHARIMVNICTQT